MSWSQDRHCYDCSLLMTLCPVAVAVSLAVYLGRAGSPCPGLYTLSAGVCSPLAAVWLAGCSPRLARAGLGRAGSGLAPGLCLLARLASCDTLILPQSVGVGALSAADTSGQSPVIPVCSTHLQSAARHGAQCCSTGCSHIMVQCQGAREWNPTLGPGNSVYNTLNS